MQSTDHNHNYDMLIIHLLPPTQQATKHLDAQKPSKTMNNPILPSIRS